MTTVYDAHIDGFIKAASEPPSQAAGNTTELIKHFEGFRPKAYTLKGESHPTIGYGTSLTPDKSEMVQRVPGLNFKALAQGRQEVSEPQATQMLNSHLSLVSNRLYKLMPQLPSYNRELQGALLNGAYRGDVFQSPKARTLMKDNQWSAASKEYLNNAEYKNTPYPGVRDRMEYNASVFSKQPAVAP